MNFPANLEGLYDPLKYFLELGGKRIRPAICLMFCEIYGKDKSVALPAAKAIELFHNFTLIHDDIMDKAPVRRGQQTVHLKYSTDQAILSGDVLLALSYESLMQSNYAEVNELFSVFNKAAIEVCEGQQLDMDFEVRDDVTEEEYLEMIRLKTSVLLAASAKIGVLLGCNKMREAELAYTYAEQLGIAFQLQDDYLDVFGGKHFGKQKGGDVISGKKTILYLKTIDYLENTELEDFIELYSSTNINQAEKVTQVEEVFLNARIDIKIKSMISDLKQNALTAVKEMNISDSFKDQLSSFADALIQRSV